MKRKLRIVYIRPSKYDDEGYVLRYWRGILPSNTLACLKSLTRAMAEAGELERDVDVSVDLYDDTVERIPVKRIIRQSRKHGTQVVVGLVGVQSNQFPRATDLALELRAAGIPVLVGGFHVSGTLALFDELTPELQRLVDNGVSLVRGEAEIPGALATVFRDALDGELESVYNFTELPEILNAPLPEPDERTARRFQNKGVGTIDTSRGCPYGCSFCTVINVQGHRMRHRAAECILDAIARNTKHGVSFYFFTDDNFARNPEWEKVLDGLAAMRKQGVRIAFMIQADTRAHRIPGFVEKLRKAGCYQVFVGMESVNPDNIASMHKTQNDVSKYREMVETWHAAGVLVHVGYIIGLPHDTRASVRRDIEILRNEIKVDIASFFMLTPLPGSKDHKDMVLERVPIDADLNNLDSCHETFRHPRMAPGEWLAAYRDSWQTFCSKENALNILLRTPRELYWEMFWMAMWYRFCALEGSHPMLTGLVRLKDRKARRPIFPRESVLAYGWRRTRELAWVARTFAKLFVEFQEIWMLTRKPDDPRWATLADLRDRWSRVQVSLAQSNLTGRAETALEEVRAMLAATSDRFAELARGTRSMSRRARKRLMEKAREADSYLRSFEMQQVPGWQKLRDAERFCSGSLLAGYEELAIRSVAKRRRFNTYRQDLARRLRKGRITLADFILMPRFVAFEVLFGVRFFVHFVKRA